MGCDFVTRRRAIFLEESYEKGKGCREALFLLSCVFISFPKVFYSLYDLGLMTFINENIFLMDDHDFLLFWK